MNKVIKGIMNERDLDANTTLAQRFKEFLKAFSPSPYYYGPELDQESAPAPRTETRPRPKRKVRNRPASPPQAPPRPRPRPEIRVPNRPASPPQAPPRPSPSQYERIVQPNIKSLEDNLEANTTRLNNLVKSLQKLKFPSSYENGLAQKPSIQLKEKDGEFSWAARAVLDAIKPYTP